MSEHISTPRNPHIETDNIYYWCPRCLLAMVKVPKIGICAFLTPWSHQLADEPHSTLWEFMGWDEPCPRPLHPHDARNPMAKPKPSTPEIKQLELAI